MPARISRELEIEVRRLAAEGRGVREIGRLVRCSKHAVSNALLRAQVRQRKLTLAWRPSPARLSLVEREEIRVGLEANQTFSAIAGKLGRAVSTVSREVAANGGRDQYRGWQAHRQAERRARRPKVAKLSHRPLADHVTTWLEDLWSPEEISLRLRQDFPDDPMMWVSHETIYQSLFVQGRGELRRELHRCLRTGRAKRRAHNRLDNVGRIPAMVNISERPAEADDRAVPGHWEGDLILGSNARSAVGTLVERTTRYVVLLHLPHRHTAEEVVAAMKKAVAELPRELFRSLTWDQGTEMAAHQKFTVDTGIQVYFCDPHSPWQRGSNENTNGLLRQYMPKGTDLSVYSAEDLARFARSLNNRPRKTLGFMKPSEKLAELLALTD